MKDLEARFEELEKRVKRLIAENGVLGKRVRELEGELAKARLESEELHNFHGKRLHIKEKIEKILHSLDAIGIKDS